MVDAGQEQSDVPIQLDEKRIIVVCTWRGARPITFNSEPAASNSIA